MSRASRIGQFVVPRTDEFGERIPLTAADSDIQQGTAVMVGGGRGVAPVCTQLREYK
jgi:NAD(P)H-flavin reductase